MEKSLLHDLLKSSRATHNLDAKNIQRIVNIYTTKIVNYI